MIIRNFYMFIWYVLWLYILFCIYIKLCINRNKNRIMDNKNFIHLFFLGHNNKIDFKKSKKILDLSKDDELFDYICECYLMCRQQYSIERENEMKIYMCKILENKIKFLARNDTQMRCLILSNLYKMEIRSNRINRFINECEEVSKLEKIWISKMIVKESMVKIDSRSGQSEFDCGNY